VDPYSTNFGLITGERGHGQRQITLAAELLFQQRNSSRMNVRLPALLVLSAILCAGDKPEYPLYSPFFGDSHRFTEADLRTIAENFDFVYGQSLSREEMDAARRFNPKVRFIKYVGSWTVRAAEAEKSLRRQILYYPCATLAEPIDSAAREFRLANPLALKPSNVEGAYSRSVTEYVTWIRVGEELMRLNAFDSATGRVTVDRGFDNSPAASHTKGDRVFLPAYGVAPSKTNEWESRSSISYHYDPFFAARWEHISGVLDQFVKAGGDGIWIDILMDRSLRESDIEGNELRPPGPGLSASWDFAANSSYVRDEFRRRNEKGVRSLQERFRSVHGRDPILYANNMMASRYETGQGGHKFYLLSTPEKPRPLDGMCNEDFMGGYETREWELWTRSRTVTTPKKACYPCQAGYKNWSENVKMQMRNAQAGLAAVPLIINAGMKTAIFEALDPQTRHEWELWAYSSYLLGVEKKNGVSPTSLGVPMFYRRDGKRFVAIDPMYSWPIGAPAETVKPEDLQRYKAGATEIYRRRFAGGLVLVNPSSEPHSLRLESPLLDPDSGARVESITLPPQSGKILLR
jgi:hypothetical protein